MKYEYHVPQQVVVVAGWVVVKEQMGLVAALLVAGELSHAHVHVSRRPVLHADPEIPSQT